MNDESLVVLGVHGGDDVVRVRHGVLPLQPRVDPGRAGHVLLFREAPREAQLQAQVQPDARHDRREGDADQDVEGELS